MPHFRLVLVAVLAVAPVAGLGAQSLPSGPIQAFDGQVVVSGEVVATVGDSDHVAYFNYTDYEHNTLRMFRVALSAAWQPARRFALVGEVRSEDLEHPRPYAAYVRIRPWVDRQFDIQAGRIPPTFGAFGRRAYSTDNPLIGYPLAYQYLTSIRADAVPATEDDLIRMRARGWRSSFPVGSPVEAPGVPLISAFRWDSGVQARWASGPMELTGAITAGTLSEPRFSDNNNGRQLSGRAAVRPSAGLLLGVSVARGNWLSRDLHRLLPESRTYTQTGFGADVEYSRDHWLVRSELVWSRWRHPLTVTNPAGENLDALAVWVETRYRFTPRIFAALRLDHLGFSDIGPRESRIEWDAPLTRIEAGAGYYIQRNLVARAALQYNDRAAGRIQARTFLAGQLSFWF